MAWTPVLHLLSRHFRVFRLVLPGFTDRGLDRKPPTLDQYAAMLDDFIGTAAGSPAIVVATSFGGQVAATLVMTSPKRISKLVLVASSGLTPHLFLHIVPVRKTIEWITRAAVFRSPLLLCRIGRRAFYDLNSRPAELCREFSQMVRRPGNARAWFHALGYALTADVRWKEGLGRIGVPTLLLWGKQDRIVPPSAAGEFLGRIPDSRIVFLGQCGHSMPLEKPEEMTGQLLRFAQAPGPNANTLRG